MKVLYNVHKQKISLNKIQALSNPLLVDQSEPNKINEDLKITQFEPWMSFLNSNKLTSANNFL